MDVNNLINMANQIGVFFESMPDRQQALHDLASHIRRFWDPRMRRTLLDSMEHDKAEGMSDIVRQALSTHRQWLT